jgi:hypothetical protein
LFLTINYNMSNNKKSSITTVYNSFTTKCYNFVKRQSYTNDFYKFIFVKILKPNRILKKYPPLPKSIQKDLMALDEILDNYS